MHIFIINKSMCLKFLNEAGQPGLHSKTLSPIKTTNILMRKIV